MVGRDDHPVADAAHLDEHLAGAPVEQPAPQRADHRGRHRRVPAVATRVPGRGPGGTGPAPRRRRRRPGAAASRSPSSVCTMRCTCSLSAPPMPDDRLLHLVGRVLDDLAAGGHRLDHGHARGLGHRDRGADVDLEQHPLDGHHVGPVLGEQRPQRRRCSAASRWGTGSAGSVRRTPAATAGGAVCRARPLDHAVAAPRQPRVDAQHEHGFEPSRPAAASGWTRAWADSLRSGRGSHGLADGVDQLGRWGGT